MLYLKALAAAALSASLAYAITPLVAKAMRARGHVRPDAHKPGTPLVPYSGGVALYAAVMPSLALAAALEPDVSVQVIVLAASATLAFVLGLVDDFRVMKGDVKTFLSILCALPLAIGYLLCPAAVQLGRPRIPLVGGLRITIIYWLLLPLVAAGSANVVNMLDVFNGVMPASTLIASLAMLASACILGPDWGLLLLAPLIGALAGYLPYNRWPARILNGDSGSLMVGAYIGVVAAHMRLEFIAAVALIPHIVNGALVIASVGGLKEHRQIKERPTILLPDFRLKASESRTAPLTLTRLVLALEGPVDERRVTARLVQLSVLSGLLAVASALLTPR